MIYNESAGGAHETVRTAAVAALRDGADVVDTPVRRPADIDGVLAGYPDRLPVAAGGDGTLHCLVAALARRGELSARPVGLIPLGTGNDLARTLAIPGDPVAAAQTVLHGRYRWMDLLVDQLDGIAVNAVHLGVGARASRTAASFKPVLGRLAYPLGAIVAGLLSRGWPVRVEVDGTTVADGRRRVLQVAIGNGTSIGGGTPITPDARPDDGQVDVVVSYATGIARRFSYAILLRGGRHTDHEQVTSLRGTRIDITGPPTPINADGELSAPITHTSWRVRPHAWRIAVPS
jgi:YegS/Rv2252/BmrU family lipid kinase